MRTIERLPGSELEIMLTLWHNETPLTVGEITKILADAHGWKTATVHVLLDRLEERGFVSCDRSGFRHLFDPIITEEEYRRGEERTMIKRFFGGSAKNM
ncbi:MAG: BlaI/MecI/CopY family transcriptional regulator, partial [Clostridia bacterium]|nr:BlaI/MecI/CopY family transcriptional regulator [Clostridia bacterium]